jgi:hypothetical protein
MEPEDGLVGLKGAGLFTNPYCDSLFSFQQLTYFVIWLILIWFIDTK